MEEQYIIYVGEEIQECTNNFEHAVDIFNSFPSGTGKRPGLRRTLVKEITIMVDKR